MKEKHVRINIKNALENLEGGNGVIPNSSPLQGMKAQSLQSLFVGEVTHASYQPFVYYLKQNGQSDFAGSHHFSRPTVTGI